MNLIKLKKKTLDNIPINELKKLINKFEKIKKANPFSKEIKNFSDKLETYIETLEDFGIKIYKKEEIKNKIKTTVLATSLLTTPIQAKEDLNKTNNNNSDLKLEIKQTPNKDLNLSIKKT